MNCSFCLSQKAALKRPKDGSAICKDCFYAKFEEEIHQTITDHALFRRGEKVAIGASGGKDSTVLAHVLHLLNSRHDYGLHLVLLSIDEGITGYRDDSLKAVERNKEEYNLPLKVVGYDELYGWTMDRIVGKIGKKNNCTFCGVFRRQALDKGAEELKVHKVATGHNADDIAETVRGQFGTIGESLLYFSVLMNILRGDVARLKRCTQIITGQEDGESIPRCKPLKFAYEKEIVLYAHFKKLDYFSTECIYSPNAYRGHARSFIKDLERVRPRAILDIIRSGEAMGIRAGVRLPSLGTCERCGYLSSQAVCKGCLLLEGLNGDDPWLGVRKTGKSGPRRKVSLKPSSETAELQGPTTAEPEQSCACERGSALDF